MTAEEKMAHLTSLLAKLTQAVDEVEVRIDLFSKTHKPVDEVKAKDAIMYAKVCQLELEAAEKDVEHDLLVSRLSLPVCAEG